jgi:hypothetical protein
VSFPDSTNPGAYFAKGKNDGAWNGVFDNFFVTQIKDYKADMPNFDAGLKGIIFGKGKTFLCLLDSGFRGYLDENEIVGDDHPLRKVLYLRVAPLRALSKIYAVSGSYCSRC